MEKIMAYSGFLIKIGNYEFPRKYIQAQSYVVGRYGQDLDSARDADGNLQRNALDNFLPKVEFTTVPMLTNTEFASIMSKISENYVNDTEKKALATIYIPETDSYMTQYVYVPDIEPTMYYADDNIIKYNPIRFAFIGYGKGVGA
jgi:hypothetical protein